MAGEPIDRREFILKTAVGLMTAGLGGATTRSVHATTDRSSSIVYRTLGNTKLRIPVVSFGVMNTDSPDLIRKALDMGFKHLDTAHVYLRGNSEKVIGEIIAERKCRTQVYISTKMLFSRDPAKKVFLKDGRGRYTGATAQGFDAQLAESLRRLCTDYIDILYLHNCQGPQMTSYEPMIKTFLKAKEAGKARFIGISTHADEPETIRAAADTGVWEVILTSYNFMQIHKEEVRKAIQYAAGKGVGVIAMKTQGGVRLNREKKVEVNHAAALRWVLKDSNVCTTIPGITTFDQMDLDFGVMSDLSLSDQEKRDLELSSMLKGAFYCQQCRACVAACPKRVEIPSLMRAYMYAEAYGNHVQAELTVDELPPACGLDVCRKCETCSAVCPYGIDIPHNLSCLMATIGAGHSTA